MITFKTNTYVELMKKIQKWMSISEELHATKQNKMHKFKIMRVHLLLKEYLKKLIHANQFQNN